MSSCILLKSGDLSSQPNGVVLPSLIYAQGGELDRGNSTDSRRLRNEEQAGSTPDKGCADATFSEDGTTNSS
jgi:hypothetical protein